jgi:hypothetical protein
VDAAPERLPGVSAAVEAEYYQELAVQEGMPLIILVVVVAVVAPAVEVGVDLVVPRQQVRSMKTVVPVEVQMPLVVPAITVDMVGALAVAVVAGGLVVELDILTMVDQLVVEPLVAKQLILMVKQLPGHRVIPQEYMGLFLK